MTKTVPEGNNVIPSIIVNDAARAIDLYTKAFNAKEEYRIEYPGSNKIMHACITIGNTRLFLADVNEQMCAIPSVSGFYVYFSDVDKMFAQATKAGLNELYPVKDMFWGDRTGSVKDPFGITWTLSTHVKDVSPEEMEAGKQMMAKAS